MSIITQAQFNRKLARLVREVYPPAGPIPWYRLVVSQTVWSRQTARYKNDWVSYERVTIITLREASAELCRVVHHWYVTDTHGSFDVGLNTLALYDEEMHPVPRRGDASGTTRQ